MKNLLLGIMLAIAGISTAQVSMEIDGFSSIKIDSDAIIEIRYAPTSKIQFNGSMEDMKSMISSTSNRLQVNGGNSATKIRIYTRDLNAIQISGAASVTVNGFNALDRLTVMTNESASLDLGNTRINNLSINQSGNSNVTATGATSKTVIKDGVVVSSK
ncbi:GIN domain-containing protein [Nonlabens agnitus]|uniref:Putative auto-transporter adhesin head GIN domain-containing protein n=1 Tax=Nonlabens agnitus TaxID=870484 RepID=A0A2S9WUM2_9FLAO|nr:DUF2807 domain-containing protein [Nonlabens agnitus]PRP67174.1 hypothetical protein BST86_08715 [Nonlabens agnitus]